MKSIYFLIFNYINYVPYAYGLLRAYTEQNPLIRENYEWKEPFCDVVPVDDVVDKIIDPDILLCSNYVWNHNSQMYIAEKVKERYLHCKVICGGPHVPDASENFFREYPFADVIVHGEGEVPLEGLLLELLEKEPDLGKVPGISYNRDGQAVKTEKTAGLPSLLNIPSPYLLGFFDEFVAQHPDALGLWGTNRGCPFHCAFCTWAVEDMNKLKLHDMEHVRQEVEQIAKYKMREAYVTDSNFGLLKRDLEIARILVDSKKKYGYPLGLRFNSAKFSNTTVFEISKLLYDNEMLWGTTLSMESVDRRVQKEVNRKSYSMERYRELKDRYRKLGLHTYTELILGLPLETRESFINGICSLFEIGIHEDIRVFELAMLPNAPLSQQAAREKYGFKTRFKAIHDAGEGYKREYTELVFETNTMPLEDWAYSLFFAEAIQALHNGGYTRFLAIYLNDNELLPYAKFYDGFLQFALQREGESLKGFKRIKRLIGDFYEDPEMPHVHRLMTQPDIAEFLQTYSRKRKGYKLYTYIWLWLSEHRDDFYRHVAQFLKEQGIDLDSRVLDLLRYQKELMLALDYAPGQGKKVSYQFTWFEYFFKGGPLREEPCEMQYTDTHMGTTHRYPLVKNNKLRFLNAAIGSAYPYSKFRHFFHQPDKVKKLSSQEEDLRQKTGAL